MLRFMDQRLPTATLPPASAFAGLMASLTGLGDNRDREPAPSETGFSDDVVSLSYEQALKNHARYRPRNPLDLAAMHDQDDDRDQSMEPAAEPQHDPTAETTSDRFHGMTTNASLRSASVTVRLTADEFERLKQRSAEAGLTVSAFLRSCAFEVETLRGQVKAAVVALRTATNRDTSSSHTRHSRFEWKWLHRKGHGDSPAEQTHSNDI